RLRGGDRLGHVQAERPAEAEARRLQDRRAVRLPRAADAPRRPGAHDRLVQAILGRAESRQPGLSIRERFVLALPRLAAKRTEPWSVLVPLLAIHWLAMVAF